MNRNLSTCFVTEEKEEIQRRLGAMGYFGAGRGVTFMEVWIRTRKVALVGNATWQRTRCGKQCGCNRSSEAALASRGGGPRPTKDKF
jgi:hypothetical protein